MAVDHRHLNRSPGTIGGQHVAEQIVPAVGVVVGERQIESAVAVEVDPLHTVRGAMLGDDLWHHVAEARPVVVIQEVVLIHRPIDIRRYVQIRLAVVVVVSPAGRCSLVAAGKAHCLGHFAETALTLVVEQEVAPVTRHEEIQTAVVVIIDDARTVAAEILRPAIGVHSELVRNVDEP